MASAEESSSRMLKEGGKLSLLTFLSRVLGLVRQMTMAAFMGTGSLADAYNVAFTLPNFFRRLFAENSMTAAFIPTFTGINRAGDEEETRDFLSATLTVLLFLVGITVALGVALAPWIVRLFPTDHGETSLLTQIMFPFLALVALAALFQGILNSVGIFTPTGLSPILFNVCWIAVPYILGNLLGNPARAMAVGVLVGGLAQAFCQLPAVLKAGYRFGFVSLRQAFRNPGMRKVFALIAPTILGIAAYQINILASTFLAAGSGTGGVSALQYSLRLQEFVLGVFVVSLGTVLLPDLSGSARSEDWKAFEGSLGKGLQAMLLITVPVAVYSMLVGRDIVTLLYRRAEFGEESVRLTTQVFFWHMSGLAFIAMNRVMAPAFYARSNTRTPTWAGLISVPINVLLAFFLVGPLRAPGIALALSGASAVNTLMLFGAHWRSGIPGAGATLARAGAYFLKLLGFSVLAGIPVYFLRPHLATALAGLGDSLGSGLSLVATSLVFGAVGIGLLALSRDGMALALVGAFRRRASGKKA